ncbi:hypothetical protein [Nocardioides sp. LHG3406-4]|uniref:hypothetical protein n=1 Tax=Nocardioides sp. LHG3406-4 TaxID=2804575 RepID=UPI003CF08433
MVIAVLALLGVDIVVLVVFVAVVLSRKRWVNHQSGAFHGAIRVADGNVEGLGPKWRRGYGRWVRDVVVWTRAPFLFRNELVAVDALEEERAADVGEVKRMGEKPVVLRLTAGKAVLEVAVRAEDAGTARGQVRTSGGHSSTGHTADGGP